MLEVSLMRLFHCMLLEIRSVVTVNVYLLSAQQEMLLIHSIILLHFESLVHSIIVSGMICSRCNF